MSSTLYHGSCLCSDIKFSVEGEPENVFNCYCLDCTENAGGPYQLIAKYGSSKIKVEDPKNLQAIWVIHKTQRWHEKHKAFCKQCGCTLWTIPMHYKGSKVMVRTSLIVNGIEIWQPQAEMFGQCRPSWMAKV